MVKQWGQERLAYEIGFPIQSRNRDAWGTWSDWEDNERPWFLQYGNWEYRIKPKEAEMAHKWASEIKAYQEGRQIQFRFNAGANAGWGGWVDIAKPAFHTDPDFQYRVKPEKTRHPHAELIIAWANGSRVEYFDGFYNSWMFVENPAWDPDSQYRLKPVSDAWAKEKAAYEQGQPIQLRVKDNLTGEWSEWEDAPYPAFLTDGNYEYRIKPVDIVLDRHTACESDQQGDLYVVAYSGQSKNRRHNVRYTFDPDTKELKQVELLK